MSIYFIPPYTPFLYSEKGGLHGYTYFSFMIQKYIVGTRKNRLAEAFLTYIHNICFDPKKEEKYHFFRNEKFH